MAQIIGLPKLSPTMEEGVLVRWVKKEGDAVAPGDLVAEVETDKANMDFTLEDEGVLLKLLVKEGDTVKLGAPVAILGEQGEDISGLLSEAGGGGKAAPAAKPAGKPKANKETGTGTEAEAGTEDVELLDETIDAPPPEKPKQVVPQPAKTRAPSEATVKMPVRQPGDATAQMPVRNQPLMASPLAKTLALELGVDLRKVRGSGPGGRIVERDVRALAEGGEEAAPEETQAQTGSARHATIPPETIPSEEIVTAMTLVRPGALARPDASDEYIDQPVTPIRKTIAQRLTQAKRDIPHFRIHASVDATPLMAFRARLNRLLGDRGKVSVNDLIIKGAALALRRVPEVNSAFLGEVIRYYTRVHIGVAVATERGLITPVVRNADLKGIGVISHEVKDLVQRAKNRQLKAPEISGSTLTISNLGMFGIDHFDAIINPPEAAILAVGSIKKVPVVEDDQIVIGERMTLTLSCDHRVVDGAIGARYLEEVVSMLEKPESLAL